MNPIKVELEYPGVEGNPDTVRIGLMDVRAADDLFIQYDFERDGWVILQESMTLGEAGEILEDRGLVEVGFAQAWQNTKETA